MEARRATWAGHGRPATLQFLGTGTRPDESMRDHVPATVTRQPDGLHILAGFNLYVISPATKFWAVVGRRTEDDS